jgi:pyrroline-5-carboxylate reductase
MTSRDDPDRRRIAILGAGNIGRALAAGWVSAGIRDPDEVVLTRRDVDRLEELAEEGFRVDPDNRAAVDAARVVVLAVQPQQLGDLLEEIAPALDPDRHLLISVVSDVSIGDIQGRIGAPVQVVRAMPNTAIAIGESMTCLSAAEGSEAALEEARDLFDAVGETLEIREELMVSATALGACGIAFFLRAVRAASQGGIEIGFHPDEALRLAAQTARGAASLLREEGSHPESELDKVTTPRGCTIAGLNEMEHQGFSSALIKGIVVSAEKADELYEEG